MDQATEVATITIVATEEAMDTEATATGHRKQRKKRKMILTTMEADQAILETTRTVNLLLINTKILKMISLQQLVQATTVKSNRKKLLPQSKSRVRSLLKRLQANYQSRDRKNKH